MNVTSDVVYASKVRRIQGNVLDNLRAFLASAKRKIGFHPSRPPP